MAYSKDEIKKITDKVLNMCKADAVEVRFSGGERSATRFANSSITANLIEHDQEISITVHGFERHGSCVLAHGSLRTFREGGFYDVQPSWVYFFRAGRLRRCVGYATREEALSAIRAYADAA